MNTSNYFNTTIIKPANYIHSLAFLELAESITYSLRDLGYVSELSFNNIRIGYKNIILGGHLLSNSDLQLLPRDTIFINAEPLQETEADWAHKILEISKIFEVWDYSTVNIEFFKKNNISTIKFLEIGYQKKLDRIYESQLKDIDVLFYGSINERRKNIIDNLILNNLKVQTLFGVYGVERDTYIARSKIILNLHSYDPGIFEVVRVSYLFANNACVISEVNSNSSIEDGWKDFSYHLPYEAIVQACLDTVQNNDALNLIKSAGYEFIKSRPQHEFIAKLI